MKKIILMLFFAMTLLTACQNEETSDLFQYKNTYVGDAGSVSKLARQLQNPSGQALIGIELQTNQVPYGILLNYETNDEIETNARYDNEILLTNATILLALVHNANYVTFQLPTQPITITREKLEETYQQSLDSFQTEEELRQFLQSYIKKEKTIVSSSPDVKEVINLYPNADIVLWKGVVYLANVDWVKELRLTPNEMIGVINEKTNNLSAFQHATANVLEVGTEIYQAQERDDILLAKKGEEWFAYYRITEG